MCGICGFLGPPRPEALAAMLARLEHRGPDDEGVHATPEVTLGVRRLAVIDVAHGRQPAHSEDRRVTVVLNGEIYNHRELRAMLARRGHAFGSGSDTEVLPHLYEEFGPDMAALIEGMFAIAVWDEDARRLVLIRDRVGEKPLLYAPTADGLAFASELRCLLAHPGVGAQIDPAALGMYLCLQYVPGPDTILRGVRRLAPGHRLVADARGVRVERYWGLTAATDVAGRSFEGTVAELRDALARAVADQLHADVPVGALLSGGVDSAGIVGLMSAVGGTPPRTFTVGFDVPGYDEREPARAVARALGTEHTEVVVGPPGIAELSDLADAMDEPVADQAALPTLLVARAAAEHVTVVLTGEGADELFGGYPRYRWLQAGDRLDAAPRPAALAAAATRGVGGERGRRLGLLLAERSAVARHIGWTRVFGAGQLDDLLAPGMRTDVDAALAGRFSALAAELEGADGAARSMYTDLRTWLVDDILTKADRMTMAASIEARAPYLDRRVVELATSLPSALRVPPRRPGRAPTKALLRAALEGVLPPAALTRRKRAFQVPFAQWMTGRLLGDVRDLLLSADAATGPLLERGAVEALLRAPAPADARRIWTLTFLELWMRRVPVRV